MTKCIVFDRDGTLIKYVPYLKDPEQVELLPFVKEAIWAFKNKGYNLFLHTNQSSISKGLFSIEDVKLCNNRLIELLDLEFDIFNEICIAEDYDDITGYRKPSTKFGNEILQKYLINPENLVYIGDSILDIQTGLNLNCNVFGVKTGIDYRKFDDQFFYNQFFYNDLLEIMNKIIQDD